jgi:hypothetical protein
MTSRAVAQIMQDAIRGAIDDKKERARCYMLAPRFLSDLCRDLPDYSPERMIRCLQALLIYERARGFRIETLANCCAAILYARRLRAKEQQMITKRKPERAA